MNVKLVEEHFISRTSEQFQDIDHLCFLSKNLYNATLYEYRQHFFRTGGNFGYNRINAKFIKENQADYRALPAKVSQWTQKQVDHDFKSFLALKKLVRTGEYDKPVRLPKYAHKTKGRKKLHYDRQAISFQNTEYLSLSQTNIHVHTKILREKIKSVEITPCTNGYKISVIYEHECPEVSKNDRYASIDMGINNLAAVTSNVMDPFLVNGKPLKSINQYANKLISKLKSLLQGEKRTSKKIRRIFSKRNNKIKDYMHKASAYIVNQLVSNDIHTLFIGYNKCWKQDATMGDRNNQNFVQIPFLMFKEMLDYKCAKAGIDFICNEESYTSKCSFLDNEEIRKHSRYSGKRIKRGLFRSYNGTLINADINGSLNIMKKCLIQQEAWNDHIWSNLVEACSRPRACVTKIACA